MTSHPLQFTLGQKLLKRRESRGHGIKVWLFLWLRDIWMAKQCNRWRVVPSLSWGGAHLWHHRLKAKEKLIWTLALINFFQTAKGVTRDSDNFSKTFGINYCYRIVKLHQNMRNVYSCQRSKSKREKSEMIKILSKFWPSLQSDQICSLRIR